jgi:hypothetical protein
MTAIGTTGSVPNEGDHLPVAPPAAAGSGDPLG